MWRGGSRGVRSRAAVISQVKPNAVNTHTDTHSTRGQMDLADPIPPVKQPINPGDVAVRWVRSDWSECADKEDGGI